MHQETFGKSGCRRIVPGQYLAVDPKGRAVMIGEPLDMSGCSGFLSGGGKGGTFPPLGNCLLPLGIRNLP